MIKLPVGMLLFFLILAFVQPFHGYVINLYSSTFALLGVLAAIATLCMTYKQRLFLAKRTVLLAGGFLLLVAQSLLVGADIQDLYGFMIYAACVVLIGFVQENNGTDQKSQENYYCQVAFILAGAGLLIGVESIILHYNLMPWINFANSLRMLGPMGQPNLLGVFIVTVFFATNYASLISTRRQWVFAVLAVFFGYIMAASASRAGFIMEIASAAVCVLLSLRRQLDLRAFGNYLALLTGHVAFYLIQAMTAGAGAMTAGLAQRDLLSIRGIELHKAIQVFLQHPWGVGYGRYNIYSQWLKINVTDPRLNTPELVTHCHNLFGQVAAEFGVIGLALVALFLLCLLRGFCRIYTENKALFLFTFSCFIAFGVNAVTEYALWNLHFGILFFIIVLPVLYKGMPASTWKLAMPKALLVLLVAGSLVALISKADIFEANAYRFVGLDDKARLDSLTRASQDGLYGKTYQVYMLSLTNLKQGDIHRYDQLTSGLLQWRPFESVVMWRIQICLQLGKYDELPALIKLAVAVQPRDKVSIQQLLKQYHVPADKVHLN